MEVIENTTLVGKHKETIYVTNNAQLTFYGTVFGDINIGENCMGIIRGGINGNIVILPGASINIHGSINGVIHNQGEIGAIYGYVDRIVAADEKILPLVQKQLLKEPND